MDASDHPSNPTRPPSPLPDTVRLGRAPDDTPTQVPEAVPPPVAPLGFDPASIGCEVLGVLGHGGMGVVYRARQVALDRLVALKVMSAADIATEGALERFQREARAAAHLEHPGIVRVYEAGRVGTQPYILMQIIEGKSLVRLLDEGPLPPRRAVELARKVALAVQYAHERGVVHRDLKPANILLDAAEEPHVADFGLALQAGAERLTLSGALVGTPSYAPPEQLGESGSQVDERSDVYGLGATLYHMVTGRPPFVAENSLAIVQRALNSEPESPRHVVGNLHRDIETICLKALEKSPARRYASAAEMAEDLRRFLDGEPIAARRLPLPIRLWRRLGRRRILVAQLAVLALGVLAWINVAARIREREARNWSREARAEEERAETESDPSARAEGLRRASELWGRVLSSSPKDEEAQAARRRIVARVQEAQAAAKAASDQAVIEKAERVDRVLERFAALCDDVLVPMQKAFYDVGLSLEETRTHNLPYWKRVEAFIAETEDDSTSQATMRACAGWARRYAGYEKEGLEWMSDAERIDPEVPFGSLLHALALLADSLDQSPAPRITVMEDLDFQFSSLPPDTEELRAMRREIDQELARAAGRLIWGRRGAEAYRRAFAGIQALQRGQFAEAEPLLTEALARRELVAIRWIFLRARVRARFFQRKFDGSLADCEELRAIAGDQAWFWAEYSMGREGKALADASEGGDPREGLRSAIAAAEEAHRRAPDDVHIWGLVGDQRVILAMAEMTRGGDPVPDLRAAIAIFGEALKKDARFGDGYSARGHALCRLGQVEHAAGLDPREDYRRAIEDLDRALLLSPNSAEAFDARGMAHFSLTEWEGNAGGDPFPSYDLALADLAKAIDASPDSERGLLNRAQVYIALADARLARRLDATEAYAAASQDLDRARRLRPGMARASYTSGLLHLDRASWMADLGEDPREEYRAAAADFDAVLQRQPLFARGRYQRGRARLGLCVADAQRGVDCREGARKALEDFSAALDRDPQKWGVLSHEARVYLVIQDPAKAAERFEEAIASLGGRSPDLGASLARERDAARKEAAEGPRSRVVAEWVREVARADAAMGRKAYVAARKLYEEALGAAGAAVPAGDLERQALQHAHYNLACIESLASVGKAASDAPPAPVDLAEAKRLVDSAFRHLEAALDLGFGKEANLAEDADLAPLRTDPRFAPLVQRANAGK